VFNAGSNKAEAPRGQRKVFVFYFAYTLSRKDKETFKIIMMMFEYGRIPVVFVQKDVLIAGPEEALFCYYGRLGPNGKQDLPALQFAGIVCGYKFLERFFIGPEFVILFIKTFILIVLFQIRKYGLHRLDKTFPGNVPLNHIPEYGLYIKKSQ
jgi:hypothetical protein